MNRTFLVSHDVPHDLSIGELVLLLSKHDGRFSSFVAVGPAGGNPFMSFEFKSREKAIAYLTETYPDESPDFLAASHLRQVEGPLSEILP